MLALIVNDFLRGVIDSFRGFFVFHKLDSADSAARTTSEDVVSESVPKKPLTTLELRRIERAKREGSNSPARPRSTLQQPPGSKISAVRTVFYCVLLNLFCIFVLQLLLLPLIRWFVSTVFNALLSLLFDRSNVATERRVAAALSMSFEVLWVLPIFVISRLVSCLWFQDIANASMRFKGQEPHMPSFSRSVADFVLSILLETLFLLQSHFVAYLPLQYVAPVVAYCHLSLLYSLYSFEYYWMSSGFELKARIDKLEANWPYFIGYGALLTLVTSVASCCFGVIVSGCLFGVFFPFFIIGSYQARDPLNQQAAVNDRVSVLPVFAPSLSLTNKISFFLVSEARRRQTHRR